MMNVRTVKLADAPTLLNIYKPYVEKTTSTFEYNVPTIQDFKDRIANTLEKYPYIVIEEDNTILGMHMLMSLIVVARTNGPLKLAYMFPKKLVVAE